MDDDDGWWLVLQMMTVCSLHGDTMRRWEMRWDEMRWDEMRWDNDDKWMGVIICNLKYMGVYLSRAMSIYDGSDGE